MKCYKPQYYDQFHCLASHCPDSCCQQWEIDMDEETLDFYGSLPGALGEKIRSSLKSDGERTFISLQNGHCPMCRDDGLCEIQSKLGHSALSKVCQEFPRLRHDYGSFVELGLELSCPEAARLILTGSHISECCTTPGEDEPEYDTELMEILLRTRTEFLTFMDTTGNSIQQILSILLLYGYNVQAEIDGGPPAEMAAETDLSDAYHYAADPDLQSVLDFFKSLEILTPQWSSLLCSPPAQTSWNRQHASLLRYLIERYWLQAVSDYDLIGRIKFMIISCILVKSLGQDPIFMAHLFSKEIENDCDNVDAILDACYASPAFTDVNLLSLLLHSDS